MNVLVLGSTGLLGQAMTNELFLQKYRVITAARHDADIIVDITDAVALCRMLEDLNPAAVINCAALVDIDACERDSGLAWASNARPASLIAQWARKQSRPFIHVSTDHFFSDGGSQAHTENAPVTLLNEYARTKFAGEALALTAPQALVLRTAIVGIRGWERLTFAEWAIDIAANDKPANLFRDAYTSSIDARSFSKAAIEMLEKGARGLYNLAATEVYSKEDFVREVARQMGSPLSNVTINSVSSLKVKRASCLGLDITKAKHILTETLPSLQQVVNSILAQYRERQAC